MSDKKIKGIPNINPPIVSQAHSPMYTMHKYWARKPHNIVSDYIQRYTQEGEIVLDPFCGSGPTVSEGLKLQRRVVGMDLNPIAIRIARMTASPFDLKIVENIFDQIKAACHELIEALYVTKCPICNQPAQIICTHWQDLKPVKIIYHCQICNQEKAKQPDSQDLVLIAKIQSDKIAFWYPTTPLAYEDGTEFQENPHNISFKTVDKLYTTRNLRALALLNHYIEQIADSHSRDVFFYAFTSLLHLASSMALVRPSRPKSGCWTVHRYYIPQTFMESNVWNLFERAIHGRQGLLNALADTNRTIARYSPAQTFLDLSQGANALVSIQNAMQLTQVIPENSIDFVFTDPPYGKDIQYGELTTLWAGWLHTPLNYTDEIIINNHQKKGIPEYETMLTNAFREVFVVLKPLHYLVVTFNNMNIQVWIAIINSIIRVGFNLDSIQYQDAAKVSAKALLEKEGSAIGDYYLIFQKPEGRRHLWEKIPENEPKYVRMILNSAKKLLETNRKPTQYREIFLQCIIDFCHEQIEIQQTPDPNEIIHRDGKELFEVVPQKGKMTASNIRLNELWQLRKS